MSSYFYFFFSAQELYLRWCIITGCFSVSNWTNQMNIIKLFNIHVQMQKLPPPRSAGNPVRYQHSSAHYYPHLPAALTLCVSNSLFRDKGKGTLCTHTLADIPTQWWMSQHSLSTPLLDKGKHRWKLPRKYNRATHLLCLIASAWRGQ